MASQQLHDGNDAGVVLGQTSASVTVGGSAGSTKIGTATTDVLSFYGTTAVSQRASSAQATSLIQSASAGTGTTAVLAEVCATLTALGLWKGSA